MLTNSPTDSTSPSSNVPFQNLEIVEDSPTHLTEFRTRDKFARKPTESEQSMMLPPNKRCIFSSKTWCIVISVVSAVLVIGGLTVALTIAHVHV